MNKIIPGIWIIVVFIILGFYIWFDLTHDGIELGYGWLMGAGNSMAAILTAFMFAVLLMIIITGFELEGIKIKRLTPLILTIMLLWTGTQWLRQNHVFVFGGIGTWNVSDNYKPIDYDKYIHATPEEQYRMRFEYEYPPEDKPFTDWWWRR